MLSLNAFLVVLLLPLLLAVPIQSIDSDYVGSDRCPMELGGLGQTSIRGRALECCMTEERSAGVCAAPFCLAWGMLGSPVAYSRRHGLQGTVVGSCSGDILIFVLCSTFSASY